jgi:hypothetical protein
MQYFLRVSLYLEGRVRYVCKARHLHGWSEGVATREKRETQTGYDILVLSFVRIDSEEDGGLDGLQLFASSDLGGLDGTDSRVHHSLGVQWAECLDSCSGVFGKFRGDSAGDEHTGGSGVNWIGNDHGTSY